MRSSDSISRPPATRNRPVVALRAFEIGDREFFASLATDERVMKFVGDGSPWSAEQIDSRIDLALRGLPPSEPGAVRWHVAETEGERAGLFVASRREDTVEIGYWLAPARWGQGLAGVMLDAGLLVVRELFGALDVEAHIDPANVASVAMVERRSFRFVGRADGIGRYVRAPGAYAE
ncbi:GNAT family N-acetyltransferase [Microbacterium esteraromaticum]|uniref:GNAT family N-acetyltransferase n=1 Tax=Microbacterium esteraromaticum TaxID=57043 RepID=UPI002367B17E|nr:GNAT family N-acetyltransferase [Microbacterium esteraromaticum]WDH79723.1 GNAT family N-acetyltransferase [Microbacterium esteraromaticum]